MSAVGIEQVRREELVEAAIHEIGARGSLGVTVGQIAKRAGVSPALAFHYFGGKDRLFLAAMRSILTLYGAQTRRELALANGPRDRLSALVRASFCGRNFQPEVVAAWLNFYVAAQTQPEAARLLRVYQHRLVSNLTHALRPLSPQPVAVARTAAALIDGLYIRHALAETGPPEATSAIATVEAYFDGVLR